MDPSWTTVGDVQDALESLQGHVEDVQDAEATLSTEVRIGTFWQHVAFRGSVRSKTSSTCG